MLNKFAGVYIRIELFALIIVTNKQHLSYLEIMRAGVSYACKKVSKNKVFLKYVYFDSDISDGYNKPILSLNCLQ
jgi:hypothetical protein